MTETGPLVALLALEEHARTARTPVELAFVMANDTRALVEYRQAVLFGDDGGVMAVSGVATVEANAPFTLWLQRVSRAVAAERPLVAGPDAVGGADAAEWADWLPPQALWLPLADGDGRRVGTLLLARDEPWDAGSLTLLERLAAIYGFAWAARHRPGAWQRLRSRLRATPRWRWWLAAAAAGALLLPVRLSVLAPAEVVPRDPAVIRAPLDGVIERVLVGPNQPVAADQPVVELDRTTILGRLEVAGKALATAQAELDQATQQAFFDPKAKAQIAVIKARVEEKAAEAAQLRDLMERAEMKSPRAGVAVMDDPSEWVGRPVAVGERVLAVADPAEVMVEAWLAPADVIALEPGAPVVLFLNTDPLAPVRAELSYVAYEATLQPDGVLAYRARAAIAGDDRPRLGLKGTVRLDGRRVPLLYWLFRRPLAAIRQWVGA